MFWMYVLQSEKNGRFYIGYSELPDRRLIEHNSGKVPSTRNFRPWKKVYSESFMTEIEAIQREKQVKAMKSRKYILTLIGQTRPD